MISKLLEGIILGPDSNGKRIYASYGKVVGRGGIAKFNKKRNPLMSWMNIWKLIAEWLSEMSETCP